MGRKSIEVGIYLYVRSADGGEIDVKTDNSFIHQERGPGRTKFVGKKSSGLVILNLRHLWDGTDMGRNQVGHCIYEFKS